MWCDGQKRREEERRGEKRREEERRKRRGEKRRGEESIVPIEDDDRISCCEIQSKATCIIKKAELGQWVINLFNAGEEKPAHENSSSYF